MKLEPILIATFVAVSPIFTDAAAQTISDMQPEMATKQTAAQIAATQAKHAAELAAKQKASQEAAAEKAVMERAALEKAAHKAEQQAAALARTQAEEKKDPILYKETTRNRNYSCEYYARRGQFYAYENTSNDIYFFKPVIDSKRYVIAEKPSKTSLGGMNSINTQRIISCRTSCRILKIQRSENNTFSLAGFIFPSTNSHYKAMSTRTIYGAAMEDLRNGCMAASIKKQLAAQKAAQEKAAQEKAAQQAAAKAAEEKASAAQVAAVVSAYMAGTHYD